MRRLWRAATTREKAVGLMLHAGAICYLACLYWTNTARHLSFAGTVLIWSALLVESWGRR